jgi:uncharacterized protein DUF1614
MRAMPTAIIALLLSREQAAPLAYIGGLIGADLLNLGSARGLGAPVASIHTASFHRAVCELRQIGKSRPLHDRSSTESGSPSAVLLCRTSAPPP